MVSSPGSTVPPSFATEATFPTPLDLPPPVIVTGHSSAPSTVIAPPTSAAPAHARCSPSSRVPASAVSTEPLSSEESGLALARSSRPAPRTISVPPAAIESAACAPSATTTVFAGSQQTTVPDAGRPALQLPPLAHDPPLGPVNSSLQAAAAAPRQGQRDERGGDRRCCPPTAARCPHRPSPCSPARAAANARRPGVSHLRTPRARDRALGAPGTSEGPAGCRALEHSSGGRDGRPSSCRCLHHPAHVRHAAAGAGAFLLRAPRRRSPRW